MLEAMSGVLRETEVLNTYNVYPALLPLVLNSTTSSHYIPALRSLHALLATKSRNQLCVLDRYSSAYLGAVFEAFPHDR